MSRVVHMFNPIYSSEISKIDILIDLHLFSDKLNYFQYGHSFPEILFEGLKVYISYLLTYPTCISSVINIGGWYYLTGAEARGVLGTVTIGLHDTLCIIYKITI